MLIFIIHLNYINSHEKKFSLNMFKGYNLNYFFLSCKIFRNGVTHFAIYTEDYMKYLSRKKNEYF